MSPIWPLAIITTFMGAIPQQLPAGSPSTDRPKALESPLRAAVDLLDELTKEPRIPGSQGYERALRLIEARCAEVGIGTTRRSISVRRAIPTRSDMLLFEDSGATVAFAGLRERWSPKAIPIAPRPAAYPFNPESAEQRGPVVALGTGSAEDLALLASRGVTLKGAIGLVIPTDGTAASLASRAAEAGIAGLLIAAPEGVSDHEFALLPVGTLDALALPCVPVRRIEANAILGRLRAKRVRGADGKAVTVKTGPGPVEASVSIECPREVLTGPFALDLAGDATAPLHVNLDDVPSRPLSGAAILAAALQARLSMEGTPRMLSFIPSVGPINGGYAIEAALAPMGTLSRLPAEPEGGFGHATLLPGVLDESRDALSVRLGGELPKRMGAAAEWIDYLLRLETEGVPAPPTAIATLMAPLPHAQR